MLIASVLIVDDDSDVRTMLSSILEDEGYSVEAVDNVKSCLLMLRLWILICLM